MDRNTINNITMRLGELSLPRDREELLSILEKWVIEPLATSEGNPGNQVDADMLRMFLSKEDFAQVATYLRLNAEEWHDHEDVAMEKADPITDEEAWDLVQLAKKLLAHATMLEVMASRFDELAGK